MYKILKSEILMMDASRCVDRRNMKKDVIETLRNKFKKRIKDDRHEECLLIISTFEDLSTVKLPPSMANFQTLIYEEVGK